MEMLKAMHDQNEDPLMGRFHYGTHYSNAAAVLHYLIRLEPYGAPPVLPKPPRASAASSRAYPCVAWRAFHVLCFESNPLVGTRRCMWHFNPENLTTPIDSSFPYPSRGRGLPVVRQTSRNLFPSFFIYPNV